MDENEQDEWTNCERVSEYQKFALKIWEWDKISMRMNGQKLRKNPLSWVEKSSKILIVVPQIIQSKLFNDNIQIPLNQKNKQL